MQASQAQPQSPGLGPLDNGLNAPRPTVAPLKPGAEPTGDRRRCYLITMFSKLISEN